MEFEELIFDDEITENTDNTAEDTAGAEKEGSMDSTITVTDDLEELLEETREDVPEEAASEEPADADSSDDEPESGGILTEDTEEGETKASGQKDDTITLTEEPGELLEDSGEEPAETPEDGSESEEAASESPQSQPAPSEEEPAAIPEEEIHDSVNGFVKPVLIGLFFAVLLAAAYVYGINYYGTHFLPNTFIDGVDVGELTAAEAGEKLATAYDDHLFRFTGRDGATEDVDISEANPKRDYDGIQDVLSAQDRRLWIMSRKPVKEAPLPFNGTFDEEGLKKALDGSVLLDHEKSAPPENAYMDFDEESGHYVVIPEVPGATVDREIVTKAVEDTLRKGGSSLDLEEIGSYIPPQILSDNEELNNHTNTLNALQDLHAGVDMGADVIESLDGEHLLGLITEEGAVEAYVTGLKHRYDTYDTENKRLFETHDGNYKLISAAWGWRLDEGKTLEALRAMVDSAAAVIDPSRAVETETETEAESPESAGSAEGEAPEEPVNPYLVEAVWKNKAVVHHQRKDYGSTYAEVDLTNQTVYVIQDGNVVFTSPCVSGRMTKGRMTPEGYYDVKLKQTNKVLVGYKPDGSVDYRSPVSYWMPFNGGIGFHDATWRGSFGGSIYVYSGSHGCINLPFAKAREMYDLVYKGMPVICYY